MITPSLTLRKGTLIAAVLALACAIFNVPAPSWAGPHDGLWVATRSHVDSPKVFWDSDHFTLKSEVGGKTRPIEETVNWVGKGYHASRPKQQYIFSVPNDSSLDFLGKPGDLLYWAPAVPGSSAQPIWAGFGADTAIPVQQFRDQSFNLDIVGFSGPGKMEMFNFIDADTPADRLFSSHDPGFRSQWIEPGTHTHNDTTFTKPGTYTIQYRATARDLNGALIASAPQSLIWQVGGTRPSSDGLGDVYQAYQAAPSTPSELFEPQFSVGPHPASPDAKPGDDLLTDLTFSTGNPSDTGSAVFYIDGFYLAEVPVQAGVATWPEMIGSQQSSFTVVYIPAGEGGSPRWISAPLTYSRTDSATSTRAAGEFPQPATTVPAPAFSTDEVVVKDRAVTFQITNSGDSAVIETRPSDPNIIFRVYGGYYETADSQHPECLVSFISSPNHRSATVDRWGCDGAGYVLKLTATPHALTTVGATTVELTNQQIDANPNVVTEFTAGPSVDPAPVVPEPQPDPDVLDKTPVRISHGHLDLGPTLVGSEPAFALVDDSREHLPASVVRDPNAVTIVVGQKAAHIRSDRIMGDSSYDFLGEYGSPIHLLPQVQDPDLPWPGFSNTRLLSALPDQIASVRLNVSSLSTPDDASWWAFTSQFGKLDELVASSAHSATITANDYFHQHLTWAFSKPGTYRMRMSATVLDKSGNEKETAPVTVTFEVQAKPSVDPAPSQPVPPEPTETPLPPSAPPSPTESTPTDSIPTESTSVPGAPGQGLPSTGTNAVTLASIAAILVTAGTGLELIRRRRSVL
ncbi:MAG: choice-of-anchor M domain-containing protein [Bowdeniella nasicola]|nr:choice-of-anchor M domain-containing protein [Bowdeniella nasicola]